MTGFLSWFVRIALYVSAVVIVLAVSGLVCYYATLYTPGPAQEGYLALTSVTVLAGVDLEPWKDATVLILDGSIVEVGADGDVELPSGATVIDLGGYTLMPGLIDLHVHMGSPALEAGEEPGILTMPKLIFDWVRFFPETRHAFLDNGVTTVRDLGNEYGLIVDLRSQLRDGVLEGPRLFVAGPLFTTPGGHPVATLGADPASDMVRLPATSDEARSAVRLLAGGDGRVDVIKVIQERGRPDHPLEPLPPEILRAIVDEAHENGLPVTVHWGTPEDLADALAAGVDGLEHAEPRGVLEGWPEGAVVTMVERGVPLTPTLSVTDRVLPPEVHRQIRQRLGEFHAAGGRVVVGTDAPLQGVPFGAGVHRELELLVESGLTPREALVAGTSEAARVLGTDRIGAIEPGRAADLVVVDGDPLQEIRTTREIVMVFRDGRPVVDHRSRSGENEE